MRLVSHLIIAGEEPEAYAMQANSGRNIWNCWLRKTPEIAGTVKPLQPLQTAEAATALIQKPGNSLPAACTAGLVFHV